VSLLGIMHLPCQASSHVSNILVDYFIGIRRLLEDVTLSDRLPLALVAVRQLHVHK
jgi:hypothetical protein